MSSQDFYLSPGTISNMYQAAIQQAGYGPIKGWRSNRQEVEVLTEGGKVLAVGVGKGNQVVITELEEASLN